jgi:hypothetical protein
MFYSASNNGFYTPEIHGSNMPEDAVRLSADEYAAAIAAQVNGYALRGDESGKPEAYTPAPTQQPAPRVVTMRQARLALLAAGKYSAVNAAMADASEAIRIEWEFAATVDRDSQTTQLLAAALNLNDTKLDELFTAAGKL